MGDMLMEAKVAYVASKECPSTSESETRDVIGSAQVAATLAVAEEIRLLREGLGGVVAGAVLDALGDLPDRVHSAISAGLFDGRRR